MNNTNRSYKLILAGNPKIPAMINSIIRATIEARKNTEDESITFRQVHIFHTEQSLNSLMTAENNWQQALGKFGIPITSFVHHVTKIEDSNVDRFRDLVEQLRTIVNPLYNDLYYVDLTGGTSALKTILAVFAYVLDIEHVYSLEIRFSDDLEERKKQTSLFYSELENKNATIEYRKFPPTREFDTFGRLNYTEVLRHRQIINDLTQSLKILLPTDFNLDHLYASLLSGTNSRLLGEVTGESYNYRHSVFSFSAGVEEIANIILTIIKKASIENKTLGQKLGEIRDLFSKNSKYFIDAEMLSHLTKLMTEIRNNVAHHNPEIDRSDEIVAIQSYLSSQLALTFLEFTVKTISTFIDTNGKLLNVKIIDEPKENNQILYFGFDGDDTGDYLEIAFIEENEDESEVLKRSKTVREAINSLKKEIFQKTKDHNSVLFAEGDNILFKAQYDKSFLNVLQRIYKEKTGLCSSIGYGKTLKETTIALRLAKAKRGDSIVGITI